MDEILEILEQDGKRSPEDIAKMLKIDAETVRQKISQYEKSGAIVKYKAVINKNIVKPKHESVKALIEVSIHPQRGVGFDYVAERIYKFSEVRTCYLVSGGFDLLVLVEGADLQSVSNFVWEKLATIEGVKSTVTHFMLKKYKEEGDVFAKPETDKRLPVAP